LIDLYSRRLSRKSWLSKLDFRRLQYDRYDRGRKVTVERTCGL
jgi:hypothetical protein